MKERVPRPASRPAPIIAKTRISRMRSWRNMLKLSHQLRNPNSQKRFKRANLPGNCNKVATAYAKLKVATSKLVNHIIIEGLGHWNRPSSSTMKNSEGSWRWKVKRASKDPGHLSFAGEQAPKLMAAMARAQRLTEAMI